MQHVKASWLKKYIYSQVFIDALLIAGYFYMNNVPVAEATYNYWGLTPLILIVASIHAILALLVYPFTRRKWEWISFAVVTTAFGVVLAAVIETSGNVNLIYRSLFVAYVFMFNMAGPYLAIAAVALAWILLIFDFLSLGNAIPEARTLNIIVDIFVTTAAILGWLFFRKHYIRDKATAQLSNLLEAEQFKSSVILESITDGVIVTNTHGMIHIINNSAATMFGWDKDEAAHASYNMLYTIQENQNIQAGAAGQNQGPNPDDVVALTLRDGKPHQKVIQVLTKNKKQFYIDTLASPIYQETTVDAEHPQQKRLVGAIVVFRDVDKQKREEQQRTEFISTASHEMRTPVAAIEGYLALAMNDKVSLIDEKARGYLEKAHASTQHLGQLFQDLLTSAKADDGRLASHPEVVEFGSYLEKIIEDLRFTAEKKGLALEFVMGTDQDNISAAGNTQKLIKPLYYVEIDPDRIREVITNLFDNAVKYTPSGKITIGLTGNTDVVQFYIKDTGAGIPPEDVPHLFQKFYRVDNSATRTIGGTGLGLFICRKIVELYNGRIWVKSRVGEGSTFFVNIPRLDASKVDSERARLATMEQPNQPKPAQPAQQPAQAKPTVVQ